MCKVVNSEYTCGYIEEEKDAYWGKCPDMKKTGSCSGDEVEIAPTLRKCDNCRTGKRCLRFDSIQPMSKKDQERARNREMAWGRWLSLAQKIEHNRPCLLCWPRQSIPKAFEIKRWYSPKTPAILWSFPVINEDKDILISRDSDKLATMVNVSSSS